MRKEISPQILALEEGLIDVSYSVKSFDGDKMVRERDVDLGEFSSFDTARDELRLHGNINATLANLINIGGIVVGGKVLIDSLTRVIQERGHVEPSSIVFLASVGLALCLSFSLAHDMNEKAVGSRKAVKEIEAQRV